MWLRQGSYRLIEVYVDVTEGMWMMNGWMHGRIKWDDKEDER